MLNNRDIRSNATISSDFPWVIEMFEPKLKYQIERGVVTIAKKIKRTILIIRFFSCEKKIFSNPVAFIMTHVFKKSEIAPTTNESFKASNI